uniref:Protein YIF1 n=3 Tax=Wuchereria bancrofti TaxID=6293 RepID=A0AAF5PV38_WUCBA
MTDPSWGWNDDSNYNAGYNANQHWQQRQEPWNNQGAYSNQPTTAMPSDKVYNNYYNQQANIPSIPMTANYSQTNQMQSFGMPSQNSYGVGNLPPFSDQFMSEPMLNAAKQIGGQFAVQQKEKLTKYLSAFHLKYYFAVDNTYVGKKLGLMLFPFLHQDWTVKYDSSDSPLPPRLDVNAPDLYIPLMAYVTYILISGFVLGIQKRFTPEQLGIITTNALAYLIFENLIIIITRYIMNISESLTFWHSLAYSSYKFVGMNICLLVFILGGKSFYYWVLAYISFAIVFFLLRTVKTFLMDVQNTYNEYGGKKRKIYLMLFIAFTQPFLIWWLTSSVTSYTPGKMDLAQYALSGIGFKEAVSKGQLPMLPSGEVDYEALLKMP